MKITSSFLNSFFCLLCAFGSAVAQDKIMESSDTNANLATVTTVTEFHNEHWRKSGISEIFEFAQDVVVATNQTSRQVVVVHGSAVINGDVSNDLVVLGGNAEVNGKVHGKTVVILGSLTLGPEADIGWDATVIGGSIVGNKKQIHGRIDEHDFAHTPGLYAISQWVLKGLLLGRPFPPSLQIAWVVAGFLVMTTLLLLVLFRKGVEASTLAFDKRPIASVMVGFLSLIVCLLLIVLLAVSVVGAILIPLVLLAMITATVLGKIGFFNFVGSQFIRLFHDSGKPSPGLSVLLGMMIIYGFYMVPFIGFLVLALTSLIGFGMAVIALFGSFKSENIKPRPVFNMPINPSGGQGTAPGNATMPGVGSMGPSLSPGVTATQIAPPSLPVVGFWVRLLSGAIDLAILLAATGFFRSAHAKAPVFVVLWGVYHILMWAMRSQTVGDIILGIKVLKLNGQPLDIGTSIVRLFGCVLSAFPLGLGFVWCGWNYEKRAWHDFIAGTVVVKERMPRYAV
ncbi:MAG: domain containing protein [Verrucomicrobiales bacterium]|nr:domain containing protein [Verrucomicrobiales bacterium]MDB6131569.1 domain containing protein [Verrucomicrobiales bacterium]